MSEEKEKPEQLATVNSQLARVSELPAAFQKLLLRRASTGAKEMEAKRCEIASNSAMVEGLAAKMLDLDPASPEYAQTSNTCSIFNMVNIMKELEYLCDCMSLRVSQRIKGTGEKAYSRLTVADLMNEMIGNVNDDREGGILQNQEIGLAMLNDIGIALKAFKDKNGVTSEEKYAPKGINDPAAEEEIESSEGLTESEAAKLKVSSPEELAKKIKEKKK